MFKHSKTLVLMLSWIILQAQTQDWNFGPNNLFEGTQLPHIYSNNIEFGFGPAGVDFSQTYSFTIPENVFSTTENIYIVIGIYYFEFGDYTQNDRVVFVDRANSQVNAAKTQFTLAVINQFANSEETSWEQLGYSIMLIGSDFSGFSDSLESSFIYGKLSNVETVDPPFKSRLFTFETSDEGSPFDYVPDADLGQGCGMIRKNGKIIIEVGQCQFSKFYVIIAGFSVTSGGGREVEISSFRTNLAGDQVYGDDDQNDYFKQDANDNQFGINVEYNSLNLTTIRYVQFSLLHIGVREFVASSYPAQILKIDDFVIIVTSGKETGKIDDLVGNTNQGQVGLDDGKFFNLLTRHKFGHLLCVADRAEVEDDMDFIARPLYTSGSADVLVDVVLNIKQGSYVCVLIGAKNICEQNQNLMKLVDTPDRIVIEGDFEVEASLQPVANPLLPQGSAFNFNVEPITQETGELKITLRYDRTGGQTNFVIYFNSPNAGPNTLVQLTVFGSIVSSQFFEGSGSFSFNGVQAVSNDLSQDTVVIYVKGSLSSSSSIQFRLRSYENVISDLNCVSVCPEKDGFELALFSGTPPVCGLCDPSLFLKFRDDRCDCFDGYFELEGSCSQLCTDPLCKICSPLDCRDCVNFAIKDGNQDCACIQGYYPADRQCLQCPTACPTCSSATNCDSCLESENTRNGPEVGCTCLRGFYDDGENVVCPKCSVECETCETTAINCVECRTSGNFQKVGTTCRCVTGYYLLKTQTAATCELCDQSCLTCEKNSYDCSSCDGQDFRELNGDRECPCISGYVEVMSQCLDKSCRSVTQNCQQCAYDYSSMQLECSSCAEPRTLVNGQCECSNGYYEEGGVCERCSTGCQRCEGQEECTVCAANAVDNGDGSCGCQPGSLLVEVAGILYCQQCASKCRECSGEPDACEGCVQPFLFDEVNKECECPPMTYEQQGQCPPCLSNCQDCQDGSSCDQCESGYVWNGTHCDLDCAEGSFKDAGQCRQCGSGCRNCVSLLRCTECEDEFSLFAGSCRSSCPAGFFGLEGVCYRCVAPCATCTSAAECESCISTRVYFGGECLEECPAGTFFGDGSCLVCDPRCAECRGTATRCIGCDSNQFLFSNDCFAQCPGVVIGSECREECPPGEYAIGGRCEECDGKCATCSGTASNCLRCANGFKALDGDCVARCSSNYLDTGFACLECDSSCDGCSGAVDLCNVCRGQFLKVNGRCVEGCDAGQFYDAAGATCAFCGRGCSRCRSLTQCEQCFNQNETPLNGECVRSCPIGAQLNNGECVCLVGNLHLETCVTQCPPTFYALNRRCQPCQQPCRQCAGSATNCLSCIEGYEFDSAAQPRCSRINSCPFGQFRDASGVCRRICNPNDFYYKTACVVRCPSTHEPNGFGGCVARTSPSICPLPQFQKGSTCVGNCGLGYFPNQATRICEQCIENCLVCQDTVSCSQCGSGYLPVDGVCILSLGCPGVQYRGECLESCPEGTRRRQRSCVRLCPENTFYLDGVCYSSCPSGQNTADACIE